MPDSDGKLTNEEQEKIISWLNEKGRNHACPVCNENTWRVGEHLLKGPVYSTKLVIGGLTYPQFFVICTNCYHVRPFIAIPVIGPIESTKPEGEKKKEKKKSGGPDG